MTDINLKKYIFLFFSEFSFDTSIGEFSVLSNELKGILIAKDGSMSIRPFFWLDRLFLFNRITSINSEVAVLSKHLAYLDTTIRLNVSKETLLVFLNAMPKEIEEVTLYTGYQHISKHRINEASSTVNADHVKL